MTSQSWSTGLLCSETYSGVTEEAIREWKTLPQTQMWIQKIFSASNASAFK